MVGSTPVIAGERRINFQWQDRFGLSGKEPFVLTINGREDEAPSISCDGMPSRKVVLDIEHLSFKVTARDDYGVKRVGMEWRGVDTVNFKTPASGKRILAAGGPEQEQLEVNGTFSAHCARHRAAADPGSHVRGRLLPRPHPVLFAALSALRPQRRAACDLAHRATQQMAPDVARSPRQGIATVRDEQAAPPNSRPMS